MKTFLFALLVLTVSSCGALKSLNSGTSIGPNNNFVLGNNQHRSFKAQLKNSGAYPVEVYQAPVGGGKHSGQTVMPGDKLVVKVPANTALVIANSSADTGFVELKVTGDTGLSMTYNGGKQ